jgi:hypothetical protein
MLHSFYLWQHRYINASLPESLYYVSAKLIVSIFSPRNGDFQLFMIILFAGIHIGDATDDEDYCSYKPNS